MANFRYFFDDVDGPVELTNIQHNGSAKRAIAAHFSGLTPTGQRVMATRMVQYKSFPSKHVCDARCLNATGRVMNCECSCGGKNHGAGAFRCD